MSHLGTGLRFRPIRRDVSPSGRERIVAPTLAGRAAVRESGAVTADRYPDWESVYRDNVDRIYRLMYAKVGNRADAEDLTAEVFIAVLRPLRIAASVGEVRAYLLAAARTVLAGHWRRTLGREVTTLAGDDVESVFGGLPESARAERHAAAILQALPENYRRILELRFIEACSVRDAADVLGISVANAKVLQHRALRRAAELDGASR